MGDRCGLTDALSPARPQEKRHARLAEAGNTAHELMAISGHKTLTEVQRYTSAADKKQLAVSGMAKMRERTKSAETYTNIGSPLHKHGKKVSDSNG
jgi:hypothetical protein